MPMILDKVKSCLSWVQDVPNQEDQIFSRTTKAAASIGRKQTKKRSKFIGVSRNGNHWQALIVIEDIKVYLGTYKSQKDAATVFDFFSIMLHDKLAKVNSSYNAKQVQLMIQNFQENGNKFIPTLFLALL